MKLGICMDGGEEWFLQLIRDQVGQNTDGRFVYVEIGIAYGETFKAVWDLIRATTSISIGIELPTWSGIDCIEKQFADGELIKIDQMSVFEAGYPYLLLVPSQDALNSDWKEKIDVAFIDGCHGKPCATKDFIALEPHIKPGGVVIFHDAGENERYSDFQSHCQEMMNVRGAIEDLGLFENKRPGWSFVEMIPTQNQCAVFRRT